MRKPRFDVDALIALYKSGKSVQECHRILGTPSLDVMYYWLQKAGVMRKPTPAKRQSTFKPNKYTLFLQKVNHHGFDQHVCWEWVGGGKGNGYGGITFENVVTQAHRISYLLFVGPIDEGKEVCHSCDVRCCVNPDNLFLGTHKENMDDCLMKGRTTGGYRKKLNEDQLQEVRRRIAGGHDLRKIAIQMDIAYDTIRKIHTGEIYVAWI